MHAYLDRYMHTTTYMKDMYKKDAYTIQKGLYNDLALALSTMHCCCTHGHLLSSPGVNEYFNCTKSRKWNVTGSIEQ